MRKLNYLVLGFTPMLTAVAFAQALNTGIKERMIVQAQAGQMGSQGQTGNGSMGTDSMSRGSEGKTQDPMTSDKDKQKKKSGYHTRSPNSGTPGSNSMQDPSPEARKGKMDTPKPSGE